MEKIFRQAIADFKTGRLSLDEFSIISNRLWWEKGIKRDKEKFKTELYETLHLAGELSFYVRASSREARELFTSFLNKVLEFGEGAS